MIINMYLIYYPNLHLVITLILLKFAKWNKKKIK